MKNEAEKIDNQKGNGVLPCVSGSKLERIAQTKKLFEEGKISIQSALNKALPLTSAICNSGFGALFNICSTIIIYLLF